MAPLAWGQAADQAENPDPEPVVRFTPEMARGLARRYTRQVLMRRYELDEKKADELAEPVARRIMAMAHAHDDRGGEFVEFVMSQAIRAEAEGRSGAGMTPEVAKGIAERILPMLPAVRDLVRDVGNDIRPKLPFKQQFKLMGDMAIAGTAINAFEQNLHRWERGEVDPFGDPFRSQEAPQKEADGTTQQLKRARKSAADHIESAWKPWAAYVEDVKKLYDLDASQAATADSLLREYTERASHLAADQQWRDRMYQNRLWYSLMQNLRMSHANPLWFRLEDQLPELMDPIARLELELKRRLDELPTVAQRAAADQKVIKALSGPEPTGTAEAAK
jgi:hypothetical protein